MQCHERCGEASSVRPVGEWAVVSRSWGDGGSSSSLCLAAKDMVWGVISSLSPGLSWHLRWLRLWPLLPACSWTCWSSSPLTRSGRGWEHNRRGIWRCVSGTVQSRAGKGAAGKGRRRA